MKKYRPRLSYKLHRLANRIFPLAVLGNVDIRGEVTAATTLHLLGSVEVFDTHIRVGNSIGHVGRMATTARIGRAA